MRLPDREAAIVFDEPGTTRDIIEVTLDIEGFPFVLHDTAGLREAGSAVEQEGIRRALLAAREADLVLLIEDASGDVMPDASMVRDAETVLRVLNKTDLAPQRKVEAGAIKVSAKTGEELDALKEALASFARETYGATEPPLITRAGTVRRLSVPRRPLKPSFSEPKPARKPSLPPNICVTPRMPLGASPAVSAPKTYWAKSSRSFASANSASGR